MSSAGPGDAAGLFKVEQDQLLPIANVGRIMKQILPTNAKVSKEARETMQECVSEFISFVTVEASDKCHKEKRKTVNGDDICWAMGTLGFDDYADPLKRYLHKYRELEGEKAAAANYNQNYKGSSSSNIINADHDQVLDDRDHDDHKFEDDESCQRMFRSLSGTTAGGAGPKVVVPTPLKFNIIGKGTHDHGSNNS